ncbi:MAG: DUF222 domain-containing protein, partial [Actinomycetia bacterium]|nr:DUF222 domain-containing protein [Actinomycetes bacterium]
MAVLRLPGIVTDDDALERALGVKRSLASMEADQYQYLLDYLDECAADADVVRLCGAERVHPYGGDGTPDIPEFAVCEIAATLGQANRTASALVADILDLRHRLPLLFGCLRNGQVDAWRVRRVASGTREFDLDTVGRVDARLARAAADGQPVIARMSRSRLRKVIDQFGCADEPEKTEDEVAENLANRFVRFAPGGIGTHEISGTVASGPARRLYARMDEITGWLGEVDADLG